MATRLSPTTFGYQNFFSATLTADITSGTLVIGLSTVPTPSAGILVIEPDSSTAREVVLYTSKGASTVTAPSDGRGYSGSTAASHLQGSTVIMAPVDKWFTALASGELSTDPLRTELFFDYVASGLVWTADAAGSTRNASMTSGVIYIQGRRLTLAAVTARSFTASRDTYIDVADSAGDGTGTITYTEVTNNAASPALTTNNVRIGIIVTGATTIATAGSVNQGQEDRLLPIASSNPYAVTDSLGNLICPRDPLRRLLGMQTIVATQGSVTTVVDLTGSAVPVIVPTGRKIKLSFTAFVVSTVTGDEIAVSIKEGATQFQQIDYPAQAASHNGSIHGDVVITPTAGLHTYKLTIERLSGTGTISNSAATTRPTVFKVELE